MTFQWRHQTRDGIDVLTLSGHIGLGAPKLVTATVGAGLTQGDRPLVVDLTDMAGWGSVGRAAVVEVLRRLAAHRRVLVSEPRDKLTLWALRESDLTVEMQPNVTAVITAAQAG